jgi:hypothetical protein
MPSNLFRQPGLEVSCDTLMDVGVQLRVDQDHNEIEGGRRCPGAVGQQLGKGDGAAPRAEQHDVRVAGTQRTFQDQKPNVAFGWILDHAPRVLHEVRRADVGHRRHLRLEDRTARLAQGWRDHGDHIGAPRPVSDDHCTVHRGLRICG